MREEKIICITCPIGCTITVRGEGDTIESIEGHQCQRGVTYAKDEFVHPVRILTTVAKIENGGPAHPLVSVRSQTPVPKDKMFEIMQKVKQVCLKAPVHRGDVVVKNVLGTGTDIIATADVFPG